MVAWEGGLFEGAALVGDGGVDVVVGVIDFDA